MGTQTPINKCQHALVQHEPSSWASRRTTRPVVSQAPRLTHNKFVNDALVPLLRRLRCGFSPPSAAGKTCIATPPRALVFSLLFIFERAAEQNRRSTELFANRVRKRTERAGGGKRRPLRGLTPLQALPLRNYTRFAILPAKPGTVMASSLENPVNSSQIHQKCGQPYFCPIVTCEREH